MREKIKREEERREKRRGQQPPCSSAHSEARGLAVAQAAPAGLLAQRLSTLVLMMTNSCSYVY